MTANQAALEPPVRPEARGGPETLRLGMPHLALGGLSEGWLLRECGSRHWAGVAASFRVPPERLEDGRGHRLYASFLAVRLQGHPLGAFGEGDRVFIETRLARLSRGRFFSRHHFSRLGAAAGLCVEMVTALLKRERMRDNTALSEAHVGPDDETTGGGERVESDLPALDKAVRGRLRGAAPAAGAVPSVRHRYRPLPQSDFNGAGLLYFASYHSMVDRAEWDWRPRPEALAFTTARREAFFFANLNPGDEVDVVLEGIDEVEGELRHRARLLRVSDGRLMAEIATLKQGVR
jgi:probable biosynthetic protein (TIGR04098 family)